MTASEGWSAQWRTDAWRSEVEAWIRDVLGGHGLTVVAPIEQPRLIPWSTLLTVETEAGRFWFKENCPGQAFEARLLEVLGALVPDAVVPVLAVEGVHGRFLMPDEGETLADRLDDVELWCDVVSQWAAAQRRLTPHVDALLAAGVTAFAPADAAEYAEGRIEAHAALPPEDPAQLAASDADRLRSLLPELEAWGAALAGGPLTSTLDHNDLHANNAFAPRPGESRLRFFDFGDAVVGHPFGSLLVPLNVLAHTLAAGPGDPRLHRVVDAYLDVFADLAPRAELRALVDPALRLARLGRHESWRRVLTTTSDEERREHGHLPAHWLRALLELPPVTPAPD
jgi:hypothetical protein